MAGRKMSATNNFLSLGIFVITLWNFTRSAAESGFIANYSKSSLFAVPNDLSTKTTVLDLSDNSIYKLEISHFRSLPSLRVLILSHNSIRELDFGVFRHNNVLEHLDISHNALRDVSGFPVKSLKHLDLAYNDFAAIPFFPKTTKLKYFGISARNLSKDNALVPLQLDTLFLDLENLDEYRSGSFLAFDAKTVRIVLPRNAKLRILPDLRLNGTESLELSKIPLAQAEDLRTFLARLDEKSTLVNLTIVDTKFSWRDLAGAFNGVGKSSINHLTVLYPTITTFDAGPFKNAAPALKSLTIQYVLLDTATFDQSIAYSTFANLNIDSFTISDSGILYVYCPETPSRFKYLNFKNNTLTDTMLKGCKNLTLLQTLILQKNRLEDLTKVSFMTTSMTSLSYMDVSQNQLYYKDGESQCDWGERITNLNLSSNKLTDAVFRCLPNKIQMLDLHSNQISAVPKDIMALTALKELNLASNRLGAFPGCGHFGNLQVLNVENNFILDQFSEFFHTCRNIRRLKGGRNPFGCHCELRQLINLQKQESVALVGWPEAYWCEYPSDLRGTLLKDFRISELECNVALLITVVLAVSLFVIAVVAFLCIRFDLPWYFRMMCRWSRVKHRIWKNKSEEIPESIQYHAFVSYSEHDANWVKTELIPNLEKEEGSLRICQHERNFIPGKSIVENIIDCIEKSYKSIFVLSPNFVQSEWCHYELYFAHHKLFSENADGLILILLESIPAYIIPARYYKLKALMAKRTYLEWPEDKRKHAFFWTNLRAALQVKLANPEEMKEL
ncbi:LOW QUALITY PROTEIN: toll-like receptor 6 [Thamnophis elegans]|uniref:LOW QUALITY PROTEIN: toll-like receptor 6 n=1 Tax=Thamnophis elegans TaxID=35005 RepID=UPI00137890C7|nr:LOW QUALITY PROTEIN: toll-like receptor 6 [Thamnophis elegans]